MVSDMFSFGVSISAIGVYPAFFRMPWFREMETLTPEYTGTGTQAGDPREARAIYESFGRHIPASETPLYVGSIKTVIGE